MTIHSRKRYILCVSGLVLMSALGVTQSRQRREVPSTQTPTFPGFVPNEKVALGVGEAILRGIRGDEYVESYKPLRARKIQGFWVVDGLAEKPRQQLRTFETAMIAIDPATCNVAVYGLMHEERMIELLKLRKSTRFPLPNPTKDSPKRAEKGNGR